MKIVLYQPQIPQNTGNIVRTCSVTGTDLVLVKPYGFSINDRWLKRAGLDYWNEVNIEEVTSLDDYLKNYPSSFYFFSSHAKRRYVDVKYDKDSLLIFGSETAGLPEHFNATYPDRYVTIPMLEGKRCLNLATSAGVALYAGLAQRNFENM